MTDKTEQVLDALTMLVGSRSAAQTIVAESKIEEHGIQLCAAQFDDESRECLPGKQFWYSQELQPWAILVAGRILAARIETLQNGQQTEKD